MQIEDHGVVRLSLVPMRADHADSSEMISQLLFGEHYRVLEISEDKAWIRIANAFDDYQGWIDVKQHHPISKEYFDQINSGDYKICTEFTSKILFNHQVSFITCGAILPLLNNPIFKDEGDVVFNGNSKSMYQKVDISTLISTAKMYQNSPYLWGGRSPFGIDCSGFTQVVFRMSGYKLPRDSSQQIMKGEEIKIEEHKAGDLAFFTNKEGKMNHVGLLIGEGEVIHASGRVRIDQIDKKGIFDREQKRYTHHLFKIKRVIK